MPVAFPESESGLDIRLLKHLFTHEEAQIALELSALPEPLERIHKRLKNTGISIEDLEKSLDNLVKKGAILGGKYYEKKGDKKILQQGHASNRYVRATRRKSYKGV